MQTGFNLRVTPDSSETATTPLGTSTWRPRSKVGRPSPQPMSMGCNASQNQEKKAGISSSRELNYLPENRRDAEFFRGRLLFLGVRNATDLNVARCLTKNSCFEFLALLYPKSRWARIKRLFGS